MLLDLQNQSIFHNYDTCMPALSFEKVIFFFIWDSQIIVLENGRVVEQGPHDVLLSRAGRYAELWGQQNYSGGVDTAIKLED